MAEAPASARSRSTRALLACGAVGGFVFARRFARGGQRGWAVYAAAPARPGVKAAP